jgi:hypothetical protein
MFGAAGGAQAGQQAGQTGGSIFGSFGQQPVQQQQPGQAGGSFGGFGTQNKPAFGFGTVWLCLFLSAMFDDFVSGTTPQQQQQQQPTSFGGGFGQNAGASNAFGTNAAQQQGASPFGAFGNNPAAGNQQKSIFGSSLSQPQQNPFGATAPGQQLQQGQQDANKPGGFFGFGQNQNQPAQVSNRTSLSLIREHMLMICYFSVCPCSAWSTTWLV